MNGPHWKSVLLLIIWCLIGSFPHWGKWGSWIWFGVLILFAILFCRRKSGIQPLFFAEPTVLFQKGEAVFIKNISTGICYSFTTDNNQLYVTYIGGFTQ